MHSSLQEGREAQSPLRHCCHLQFYKTTLQNLVWLKFVVYYRSEYERRMSGRFMDIMHSSEHRNLFSWHKGSYQLGVTVSDSKVCEPFVSSANGSYQNTVFEIYAFILR